MDVVALTAFLAPCLPFLLEKVGAPALEAASSKLGEDTWTKAKAIWSKLWPKVEGEAGAKVAAEKLADKPESAAWKEALQDELEVILKKDEGLARAIVTLFHNEATHSIGNQVNQTFQSNQGQVSGQMFGGEVKKIDRIDTVQGDINL